MLGEEVKLAKLGEAKSVKSKIKKVKFAILHQAMGIPKIMNPHTTISAAKVPGIKMQWVEGQGLCIELKGEVGMVPAPSIAYVSFMKEE